MKTNYVYIVKCQDNTFYTGWTTDLVKRINAHNHGKGAKYTKARRPVEPVSYTHLVFIGAMSLHMLSIVNKKN